MDPSADDLAGVADLFGGLTREEIHLAIENLAARHGSEFDPDTLDDHIDEAVEEYAIVPLEREGVTLFAPGPVAFPKLPEHGSDLPHMMDVPRREVDRERLADAAHERFRADAVEAIEAGDEARIERLLDLCYEMEAWASLDLSETRERLDDALEE